MQSLLEQPDRRGRVPEFGLGDRIMKAVETSPYSVQEVAAALEVNRNTLSRWMHGRNSPTSLYLRELARVTGVDLGWLRTGSASPPLRLRAGDTSPDAAAARRGEMPTAWR